MTSDTETDENSRSGVRGRYNREQLGINDRVRPRALIHYDLSGTSWEHLTEYGTSEVGSSFDPEVLIGDDEYCQRTIVGYAEIPSLAQIGNNSDFEKFRKEVEEKADWVCWKEGAADV